jgi:hypothetical protein
MPVGWILVHCGGAKNPCQAREHPKVLQSVHGFSLAQGRFFPIVDSGKEGREATMSLLCIAPRPVTGHIMQCWQKQWISMWFPHYHENMGNHALVWAWLWRFMEISDGNVEI